ncbi:hypothetical protein AB6T38_07070 [Aliiglaciecola sp. SL4]|uniref:hypothetical protein n=1 Tax=Aliiglaciecola sp. SL4 TaxID=3239806 RepID=UPI00355B67E3
MNCTTLELMLIAGFFVSLLLANFSSWRMHKSTNINGDTGAQWKFWITDANLPNKKLMLSGNFWRWVSIWAFVAVVVFGGAIAILNAKGSHCFGIST